MRGHLGDIDEYLGSWVDHCQQIHDGGPVIGDMNFFASLNQLILSSGACVNG